MQTRLWTTISLALLICGFLIAAPRAQLPLTHGGAGILAYTGPGDIVTGWVGWWGLRAFSAATRGNKIVNVCNSTGGGSVCADMVTDSNGILIPKTINGGICPGSGCTIQTWYDQSSAGLNITQSTVASQSSLATSCTGLSNYKYCASSSGSESYTSTTNGVGATVPYSSYATYYPQNTAGGGGEDQDGWFQSQTSNSGELIARGSNGTLRYLCGGSVQTITVTLPGWFANGFVCNGSSGATFSNGTFNSSVNSGSGALVSSGNPIEIDSQITGAFSETGIATGAWSSTTAGSIMTNSRNFWGF